MTDTPQPVSGEALLRETYDAGYRDGGHEDYNPETAISRLNPSTPLRASEGAFVLGPVWQQAEEEGEVWTSEVQTVGGHAVVATVHGRSQTSQALLTEARRFLSTRTYDAEEGACLRQLVAAHERALIALDKFNGVRPENWEDEDDPDQFAAWRALDEALGIGFS